MLRWAGTTYVPQTRNDLLTLRLRSLSQQNLFRPENRKSPLEGSAAKREGCLSIEKTMLFCLYSNIKRAPVRKVPLRAMDVLMAIHDIRRGPGALYEALGVVEGMATSCYFNCLGLRGNKFPRYGEESTL